ncbi:MAG: helix-turn-helix domain-containing protein, partial [Acidobacteriaceae bacterium]
MENAARRPASIWIRIDSRIFGWIHCIPIDRYAMQTTQNLHESKRKLLDAALHVIREKGYEAARIEDICEAARLTKGSFFHHFKSKDELGLAVTAHWSEITAASFSSAPYHAFDDPLDRLLA